MEIVNYIVSIIQEDYKSLLMCSYGKNIVNMATNMGLLTITNDF